MTVIPLTAFKDNYIWTIPDENEGVFDCVDPGDSLPVIEYAKKTGLSLRSILLTHHHSDHIGGVKNLINHFPNAHVYAPNDPRIQDAKTIALPNQTIKCGKYLFQVFDTPGHTSTHISYYEPDKQWLFCGDTLFSAGCGRVFDGTMKALHESLLFYKNLPENTLVFCAHEYTADNLRFALTIEPDNQHLKNYEKEIQNSTRSCTLPSTIKMEKKINPFLRTDQQSVQKFAENNQVNPFDNLAVFTLLRTKKNNFS